MGIPKHLTCLPKNLYSGQEATVTTRHGTTDCFNIVKGACQGCILSPYLFNFYAEYIMRNTGLDEAQAGIKIARNLRYADWQQPYGRRGNKEPTDEHERGQRKNWLKTHIQQWSWHQVPSLHGKQMRTMGTVRDFTFLGSKIIVDGDSSHEIKMLTPWKKLLDNILKSRAITLPTNVHIV